jgi:mRNA-degrading endonuclease RelE of RelBE toxin-antitoxin system
MANVELTPDAARQKDQLPRVIKVRIVKLIERLKDWPHVSGAKPLSGELAGHWRMRTGDYRLQFHVEGETVVIEKVGHRDGFYED